MKKIALISSNFTYEKPGGVATLVEGRAEFLRKNNNVRVFALGKSNDINHSVGRSKYFKFTFILVWVKLIVALLKFKPNEIEVHNIPVGLPVFLVFNNTYFFHGPAKEEAAIEHSSKTRIFLSGLLEKIAIKFSFKIYTASQAFRDKLHSIYPKISINKSEILLPKLVNHQKSITSDRIHEIEKKILDKYDLNKKDLECSFVTVRRLVTRTGVPLLLESFIEAKKDKIIPENSKLFIIGDGPEYDKIKERISTSSAQKSVYLLGKVSNDERDFFYSSCFYNVVPTLGLEGFGLIVLEAGYLGCPSIVTNINALPEVINALDNKGIVVNPDLMSLKNGLRDSFSKHIDREGLKKTTIEKFFI